MGPLESSLYTSGVLSPAQPLLTDYVLSRYECCFHVQEYNINSAAETRALITSALTSKYEDGGVAIHTTALTILQLGRSRLCQ